MQIIKDENFEGERALFMTKGAEIQNSRFFDGESPLKESADLKLIDCVFQWKYPLWYCNNVEVNGGILEEGARAGIWYTDNISMKSTEIIAPKTFRRCRGLSLENIAIPNAAETLWDCDGVKAYSLTAKGDYFGMNSRNIVLDNFSLEGNYPFDGSENVLVRNSRLISKDAFWNTKNIEIHDSYICGEYFGWNSENITLVNCRIESHQGFCYIKNLKMINCTLENSDLCFEYSTLDAEINSVIDSVKNPSGGKIKAQGIEELIMEKDKVDTSATVIEVEEK